MRVLDVGSGGRPHLDATHLCDAHEENLERGGDLVKDGRPFVYARIENMPFKSGTIDYLYAVHVLKHTDTPYAALSELTRLRTRGYIETPTPFVERLYGWKNHRCTVSFSGGFFTFGSKIAPQANLDLHAQFKKNPLSKAVYKGLDIVLNLLYLRIEFSNADGRVHYRKLGRRQALYDMIHDPLAEGVGPRAR